MNNTTASNKNEKENPLFPVFLKLNHLKVVLIGGGNVAAEKLNAILSNSPKCEIKVVASQINEEIRERSNQHKNITLAVTAF